MENVTLLPRGKVVELAHPYINSHVYTRITTTNHGDFRNSNGENLDNLHELSKFYNATTVVQMIPKHGTEIQIFKQAPLNPHGTVFLNGDAIIFRGSHGEIGCLIHCSWMTLSKGIIEKVVKTLKNTTSILKRDFHPQIYSGICQRCYEVDETVMMEISPTKYKSAYRNSHDKYHKKLNLSEVMREKLVNLGFNREKITNINLCSCHHNYQDLSNGHGDIKSKDKLLYSLRERQDIKRNLIFSHLPLSNTIISATTGNCPYLLFILKERRKITNHKGLITVH